MSELNLIIPYCCITGSYCSYNTGFVDGYMIGIATIFLLIVILNCIGVCFEVCKGKQTVESDDEEDNVEKSAENKKDD